jgi:hypothetical protein
MLMRRRPFVYVVRLALGGLVCLAVTHCVSTEDGTGRDARSEISRQMIQEKGITRSAYEAVQRLRPSWLRGRGPTSFNDGGSRYPKVYIDGMSRNGPPKQALSRISVQRVKAIRFLGAGEATMRFGSGNENGVILVVTQ